jgi:hypothetical protein
MSLKFDAGNLSPTFLDLETAREHDLSETPEPATTSAKQMIKRNLSQISDKVAKLSKLSSEKGSFRQGTPSFDQQSSKLSSML